MRKFGFTLIELLISVTILAILAIGILFSVSRQRGKAEDARIKAYLNDLKIAFENYYNDKNCYPPPAWFDDATDCNSTNLQPYLKSIQCDKKTGLPFLYEIDATQLTCPQWFKIYATFNVPDTDEQALAQRTNDVTIGSTKGNYGISSSNVVVSIYSDQVTSSPTPTPTLDPTATYYYCLNTGGGCTTKPANLTCDRIWINDANCGGNCTPSICTVN